MIGYKTLANNKVWSTLFTASQKKTLVLVVVKTEGVGKMEKCVNCNGLNRKIFN